MATRDATKIDRASGRFVKNPTNLALAFPYGGTELGAVFDTELEVYERHHLVLAEEYGGIPIEGISGGEWCNLFTLLRGWDDDAVAAVWPNTRTGASGSKAIEAAMAPTVRAGALLTDRAIKALFVPDNAAHRAVYLPRGGPVVVPVSRTKWGVLHESDVAVMWVSFPDASGRTFQVEKLGDITL